jgi:ADP-dependent NAD(P)H-hydrate dehydratase / NAD(P)H-hydrate epimerase
MKVVTTQQMREADRQTIAGGTSGDVLMSRAGTKVVEFLESEFAPLERQRVVIFCGAGNNGGDGLVVGRLLKTRVASVQIVRVTDAPGPVDREATIVIDALLGTGAREPLAGRYAELIATINGEFPRAKVVAVDIPSAMQVRSDFTVTFAAPKAEMLLDPRAGNAGKLIVADIGIPAEYLQSDLELSEPHDFAPLFQPRKRDANKGDYGHVLVVGGAPGKTGSVAMSGLAALRIGAGLVTVACADSSRLVPELMTQSLDAISLDRMTVLAIGPGLGLNRELVSKLTGGAKIPTVIDADGLNSIAGTDFRGRGVETVLTPHPGEMGRLLGLNAAVKPDARLPTAQQFATDRNVCLVLKGFRTLIAFPDGKVWINPTGSPALAKGGTGDVLTGLIAGLIAQAAEQVPPEIGLAVRAAVWLHGRAGELAAEELTEHCVLATDLLTYLPRAIREIL